MQTQPPSRSSTRAAVTTALVLAGVLAAQLLIARSQVPASHAPEPPPLYLPRSSCSAGDDPAAFARALEQNARAKLERAAFVPGDAVRALGLISEAALCHAAAGDAAAAEAARDELQHRAQQLEADYRERRARLALALADGRVSDARSESHGLLQLLADHDDDYTRWLRHIERGAP